MGGVTSIGGGGGSGGRFPRSLLAHGEEGGEGVGGLHRCTKVIFPAGGERGGEEDARQSVRLGDAWGVGWARDRGKRGRREYRKAQGERAGGR